MPNKNFLKCLSLKISFYLQLRFESMKLCIQLLTSYVFSAMYRGLISNSNPDLDRHVQVFPDVLLLAQLFPVAAEAVRDPGPEGEVDALSVPDDEQLPGRGRRSPPQP
jgi:hypothetical protein